MTGLAIVLVITSAFTHAGWNFFGKQRPQTVAFYCLVSCLCFAALSPFLLWQQALLSAMSPTIWRWLLLSGVFQAVYLTGLSKAYQTGDMSTAYPIARAVPVLLVACLSVWLVPHSKVSFMALCGMVAITLGCFSLPLTRFRDASLGNYLNPATLFALVAAFATTGYSFTDDHTTRLMRGLTDPTSGDNVAGPTVVALCFVILQSGLAGLWLLPFTLCSRRNRREFFFMAQTQWARALGTGLLMLLTYSLVILSMAFVDNVSYVVALRQLSIPLGVLFAVIGLKEPLPHPRWMGVCLTFAGLVIVALS